jgi:Uma2 family endonuclease
MKARVDRDEGGKAAVETWPPQVHRWTVDEYARAATAGVFDGHHVELIDGALLEIEMTQSPAHNHAILVLAEHLRTRPVPGTWHVRVQMAITAGPASEPEPDIAVVPGTPDTYRTVHPTAALLVVEVAESSLRVDRTIKAALYASAGVPTYWLVDLWHRVVEVYTEPADDRYARLETLKPGDLLDGLAVAELFGTP